MDNGKEEKKPSPIHGGRWHAACGVTNEGTLAHPSRGGCHAACGVTEGVFTIESDTPSVSASPRQLPLKGAPRKANPHQSPTVTASPVDGGSLILRICFDTRVPRGST